MKAKELFENRGMLARGPSGINFPRGFDPRTAYSGMYPGDRFAGVISDYPTVDDISSDQHVKMIDQRIAGGMSLDQAIEARAAKLGMDSKELRQIYFDYKKQHQLDEEINCRSDEGITVGLIDSFITNLRLFKTRDLSPGSVQEALLDVADDPDFGYFLEALKEAKKKAKK